jgi:hypothetical protein
LSNSFGLRGWPSFIPIASQLPVWKGIGPATVLQAIAALPILQRKRRPYFAVGWFWFAGVLVPVIGLVQVGIQSRADRYMYIPLIGLSVIAVWCLHEISVRRTAVRPAAALGFAACCAYGAVASYNAAYWRDTVTLFRHAIDVTENNWGALDVVSQALLRQNRVDEAMPYIAEVLRLRPNLPEAHIDLASALSRRGDLDAAGAQYRKALQLDPDGPDAREGLGVIQTEKCQLNDALANLTAAERAMPGEANKHYNLGRLYGWRVIPIWPLRSLRKRFACSRRTPRRGSISGLPMPPRSDSPKRPISFVRRCE